MITNSSSGAPVGGSDGASVALALRGYVKIPVDKGLLKTVVPPLGVFVKPSDPTTRASLAAAIATFRSHFVNP